jgi:hypothetical protein
MPACLVAILAASSAVATAQTNSHHVFVISIDGMHAVDLARYVRDNPGSALAYLVTNGYNYTSASTPTPADSFPGLVALFTGGSPVSTGIYFDRSYDRSLWPPNTTSGPTGTSVIFDESADINSNALDGGGGLNENALPRDPARDGAVVYPHNYLRVNTVFEVIKAAGYRTAWCDKHLTDEIVLGPSGQGVDDLYVPEIAANNEFGVSINKSLDATEAYDDMKVQSVLNQIGGYDHTGSTNVGVPAIFGMNFQAVSVAQKLRKNKSITGVNLTGPAGGPGGYLDGAATPSYLLSNALAHTDASIQILINALRSNSLLDSTYIVLMAKHGQSPIDPTKLAVVNPSVVTSTIDPAVVQVAQATEDTAAVLWLQDQAQTDAATSALLANQVGASIESVWSQERLKLHFGDPQTDPRAPDIIALGKPGTIYTTSGNKIGEHGGFTDEDVNVPIVISNPNLAPQTIRTPVRTMQIAPTILQLLGLNPYALQAVRIEKTAVLPGFDAAQVALNPLPPSLQFNSTSMIQLTNGQAQFQVVGVKTQRFFLQGSSDLTNWTTISTNTMVLGASITVTDPGAVNYSNRFYRAASNP